MGYRRGIFLALAAGMMVLAACNMLSPVTETAPVGPRAATAASSAASSTATGTLLPEGYHLVWDEEFDKEGGGGLDPKDWNFERGFVRNQELQWYQSENARRKSGDAGH